MNQLQFKWNSTDLFTEVSNTFVIVTAHKQVCANQKSLSPQTCETEKNMKKTHHEHKAAECFGGLESFQRVSVK